jgi:hypothetical protein
VNLPERQQKSSERKADSEDFNKRWITSLSAIPPSFKTAISAGLVFGKVSLT